MRNKKEKFGTQDADLIQRARAQEHNTCHPATGIYVEAMLAKEGLLSSLEQSGALPIVKNPNPHDPVQEPDKHDGWWREHPDEATAFNAVVEQREAALRGVYIGTHIGIGRKQ